MNVNKTIHEAMGLCWHEFDKAVIERLHRRGIIASKCNICKKVVTVRDPERHDYMVEENFCALMEWMTEVERADQFDMFAGRSIFAWLTRTRQEQINLIAEAIEAGVLS